ncbi:MAG: hypothetical protein Q4E55_05820 [Bacteroidales bacterium]|nr:hypothetical protein [Bacteroidales bacterium]
MGAISCRLEEWEIWCREMNVIFPQMLLPEQYLGKLLGYVTDVVYIWGKIGDRYEDACWRHPCRMNQVLDTGLVVNGLSVDNH